mgnify:CR=1 FL=1
MDNHLPELLRRKRFIIPTAALAIGVIAASTYAATRPNPGELKSIKQVSTHEGEQGVDKGYRNLGFRGIYGYNEKNLTFVGSLELECTRGNTLLPTTVTASVTSVVGNLYLDARLPSIESEGNTSCAVAMDALTPQETTDMMGDVLRRSFGNIAEEDRDQTNNSISYTLRELTPSEQETCSRSILQEVEKGVRATYPC